METPITELHHGNWWTNSWRMICNDGENEVYIPLIFIWMVSPLIKIHVLHSPHSIWHLEYSTVKHMKKQMLGKLYIFTQMHLTKFISDRYYRRTEFVKVDQIDSSRRRTAEDGKRLHEIDPRWHMSTCVFRHYNSVAEHEMLVLFCR